MNRVVLDTNAYTALLAGNDEVLDAIAAAEIVYMSIFVLGELHAGFRRGSKLKTNLETLKRFLEKPIVIVLPATEETAEVFGHVKADLTQAGHPLPINDVWIAAHTLETGAVLITYDRHFHHVPGLRLWLAVQG